MLGVQELLDNIVNTYAETIFTNTQEEIKTNIRSVVEHTLQQMFEDCNVNVFFGAEDDDPESLLSNLLSKCVGCRIVGYGACCNKLLNDNVYTVVYRQ